MRSDIIMTISRPPFRQKLLSLTALFAAFSMSAGISGRAESAATDDPPQASASVSSVTEVTPGRFRVVGTALDRFGNPACALALASGQCVFTCGAGSGRCDGSTANSPYGQFDLTNLMAEPDGTITLQVFIQGHVSYTKAIPAARPAETP